MQYQIFVSRWLRSTPPARMGHNKFSIGFRFRNRSMEEEEEEERWWKSEEEECVEEAEGAFEPEVEEPDKGPKFAAKK